MFLGLQKLLVKSQRKIDLKIHSSNWNFFELQMNQEEEKSKLKEKYEISPIEKPLKPKKEEISEWEYSKNFEF